MVGGWGDHLSGRATGRVDLARSLAVITGDFAQEVELRRFFASRIDVIGAKAAIAKTSAKDLELARKGGNERKARTVVHDINETMRSAGEDFDSSGDDLSEYLKCAPPTRQTPSSALHRRPHNIIRTYINIIQQIKTYKDSALHADPNTALHKQ